MKAFLHIIKKESLSIFRDKASVIALVVMPMLVLLICNQIISTDMHHITVEAVVQKPSKQANEYLTPLRENDLFVYHGTTTSIEEGMRLFKDNDVQALVVIDKDFNKQIITDNSNTVIGTTANYYITSALNAQVNDVISTKMLYNPGMSCVYQFGVGVFALFLIIQSVMACASSMVREKEHHSTDSIILSSVSTWQLMLGKMLPHLILNTVLAAIALTLSHYVIGLPIRGSFWVFALLSLICIVTTMLLGTFISLCSATEANALSTAITVVCLPGLYFSGIIYPVDSMPEWANYISYFVYARWFIDAAREILLQGVDFTYVIKETSIMLLNMMLFLVLCLYKLKNDRWLR